MADFLTAYLRTIGHEKLVWSDRKTDAGGETFGGISRRWWPDWQGWTTIDSAKGAAFPSNLRSPPFSESLEEQVRAHYEAHFWRPLLGAEMASQAIANEVFDQAVNRGRRAAVEALQRALNFHSGADRNWLGGSWRPVDVDGRMGRRQTLPAVEQAVRHGRARHVAATMLGLRLAAAVELTERRSLDRANAGGWKNRIVGNLVEVWRVPV